MVETSDQSCAVLGSRTQRARSCPRFKNFPTMCRADKQTYRFEDLLYRLHFESLSHPIWFISLRNVFVFSKDNMHSTDKVI